jgi:taurine-transporting ATPase
VIENVSKSFARKEKEITFALSPVNLRVERESSFLLLAQADAVNPLYFVWWQV